MKQSNTIDDLGLGKQGHLRGVRVAVIRKNSPQHLLLRRLREYFLYSKLRSLIPHPHLHAHRGSQFGASSTQIATEFEPPAHEIPDEDSDEETPNAPPPSEVVACNEENRDETSEYDNESEEEVEIDVDYPKKAFEPSIKIDRMDKALLISIIVLKDVAKSSALFRVLEEEKLDILFENQYRTETKVTHTIQATVDSDYDVDALERKLQTWARTGMHS